MLKFLDDTEVAVKGLDETLAELYTEGRLANEETVTEIVKRLEAQKNYIPPSDHVRGEYAYALMKEYKKYLKSRADNK
jgi:hypothetical protein